MSSLAAWTWGDDASLPLVIGVHDLAGNGLWWADLADACALRLRFAALDLRGRGGSWALGPSASVAQHVEDVLSTADALSATCFLVAGHGTGSVVAMQVADTVPDRVSGIVLLDGPPDTSNPGGLAAEYLDPGVARMGTTYAHRDEHLRAGVVGGWLPSTGLTRNARRAVCTDLVGSGFGWQVRLDRRAIENDLSDLSQWTAPDPGSLPPIVALRAAQGHRPEDPPLALLGQPREAHIVPTTHAGLLLDPVAVPVVADALAERFGAG